MLRPETFNPIPDQEAQRVYISSPLGDDLKHLHRPSHLETGALVIDAMRDAFAQAEITYTPDEMISSIITSLELSPEEQAAIIPDPQDHDRIERTFLGLVYAGSKQRDKKDGFAEAMRLEFIPLKGSNIDVLSDPHRGIEDIVGRYHYAFDSGLLYR